MPNNIKIKEEVFYIADSGLFFNKSNGKKLGYIKNGYVIINIKNIEYLAHRLAWLYEYGKYPEFNIDHINGDKTDNRVINLRDATYTINNQNRRTAQKNNKIGLLGCSYHKRKKLWQASICIDGKDKHIGYFKTAELAHNAYIETKRIVHEGCTI